MKSEITTLEGLAKDGKLHPLQQAWIDEQVPQCGFCQNGQIMTAKALLDKNPKPTDAQIRRRHEPHSLPLHDVLPRPGCDQTRGEGDRRDIRRRRWSHDDFAEFRSTWKMCWRMAGRLPQNSAEERRHAGGELRGRWYQSACTAGERAKLRRARVRIPDVDFHQVDSWIVIHEDSSATFYVGKTDCGQGTGTSFRQIMSDELDVAYEKTTCIMGSTDITVDQGGSGGSTAMERDSWPMRRVAAEARRVLLEMGSRTARRACGSTRGERGRDHRQGRSLEERHLWTTDRREEIQCHADRQQYQRDHAAIAAVKPVQELKNIGLSPQRYDIPAESGWVAEMGRGCEAAGHGSRAECEAAGGGRETGQHRRIFRPRPARIREGGEQGQLCRGGVRAGRAGDQRSQEAQGELGEARHRAVPIVGKLVQLHARGEADVQLETDRGGRSGDRVHRTRRK